MRLGHDPDELFSPRTDRQATRRLARDLLALSMRELDNYVREDGARVNPNRWKAVAARDSLQLHRERDHVRPGSPTRSLLVSGRLRGRVEHALFAASSESLEQLALLHAFLFGDAVIYSSVSASLEPPAATYVNDGKPHRDDWLLDACALSVKSVSRRGKTADADTTLEFLEYSGFTRRDTSGELVGFYIVTPTGDMSTEPAVRCLFRQLSNDVVDVFLVSSGSAGRASSGLRNSIRGSIAALSPWSTLITTDVLFNMANLLECADAKQLTIMLRAHRQALQHKKQTDDPGVIAMLESADAVKRSACGVCQRKKKIFHVFTSCEVCGQTICMRCRLQRRVFVPRFDAYGTGTNGGFFQKVAACKPCAVSAATDAGGRQSRTLSMASARSRQQPQHDHQHQQSEENDAHESARRSRRTRREAGRFRIQSTATPRASRRHQRSDSNGSASSMPTPHGSKATPKHGGVLLFSHEADSGRARKVSSASDTGIWCATTPRARGSRADGKRSHRPAPPPPQARPPQTRPPPERFPRFASGFNVSTTPGSTKAKESMGFSVSTTPTSTKSEEPMGFAVPTDAEIPRALAVECASSSMPSTPTSSAASPSFLMQRMLELRKLAEISYDTTRRNNDMLPPHRRSGRVASHDGGP